MAGIDIFLAGAGMRPANISSSGRIIARAHAGRRRDGALRRHFIRLAKSVYRLSGGDRLHGCSDALAIHSGHIGILLVAGAGGSHHDTGSQRPVGLPAGEVQQLTRSYRRLGVFPGRGVGHGGHVGGIRRGCQAGGLYAISPRIVCGRRRRDGGPYQFGDAK